jgi:urease beta subunit
MRPRSFRPRLESLDERSLPSLTLGGTYPVADYPFAAATGDFNGDGRLDLATRSSYSFDGDTVSVFLGAGDGSFGNAQQFPAFSSVTDMYSHSSVFMVVGDFNGDGYADLATGVSMGGGSDWGPYPTMLDSGADTGIEVLFGDGGGSLHPVEITIPDSFFDTARVADIDADGRSDLVLYGYHDNTSGYFVTSPVALLGNSDDSFTQTDVDPADPPPMPAPDINSDGYGDVVSADGEVGVQLGRADGSFVPTMYFSTGQYSVGTAVGDFDGDGRPDVAALNPYTASTTVLLNDGDWPPTDAPTILISDAAVTEGHVGTRAVGFTVTLSAPYDRVVTVDFATADSLAAAGSDYQATGGTLTFEPGQTTKTVLVPVNGDRLGEPDETFVVNLSSPTNAIIADGQGVGRILDDEPRISVTDVTKAEGGRNKTTLFTFTVTLSAAYDQSVTVSYRTLDVSATTSDNDYIAKSGTLTFAPGETTKTITIEVKGDRKKEGNEYFLLDLYDNCGNSWFTKNRGEGWILNDDR